MTDEMFAKLLESAPDAMIIVGGAVAITTANLPLNETDIQGDSDLAVGDYVKLSVGDTGRGLSREAIGRAFEPSYTTKEVGQGSGLGLGMDYGFSRRSGGHAEIESIEGQGASVSIYLPRASQCQPLSPAQADPATPHGKGETILVVEDGDRVRDVTVRLVRNLGYEVMEARDAKAALEADDAIEQDAARLAKPYRAKALALAIRKALGDDGHGDGT